MHQPNSSMTGQEDDEAGGMCENMNARTAAVPFFHRLSQLSGGSAGASLRDVAAIAGCPSSLDPNDAQYWACELRQLETHDRVYEVLSSSGCADWYARIMHSSATFRSAYVRLGGSLSKLDAVLQDIMQSG